MARIHKSAPGEYMHIFNRGNNKQSIFTNEHDRRRFLFGVLFFQAPVEISNISRFIAAVQPSGLHIGLHIHIADEVIKKRTVEVVSFTLMDNHFHLIVHELKKDGIPLYLSRIQNSYTQYVNTKYERTGHLFQGPYKSIRVASDEQLLYLSAYIHRNSRELKGWKGREHIYPWSSYQDYIGENRWGKLLVPDIVLDHFENKKEYRETVEESGAKEMEKDLSMTEIEGRLR